jgi:hypothetical protein
MGSWFRMVAAAAAMVASGGAASAQAPFPSRPVIEGEMPDAGHLFELFQMWTPDPATQHRILVANPARLYGFPN